MVFYCVNAPIYPVLIPWLLSLVGLDTTSGNTLMRLACCLGAVLVNLAVAPRVSISATTYTCAHREHVARPVRDDHDEVLSCYRTCYRACPIMREMGGGCSLGRYHFLR